MSEDNKYLKYWGKARKFDYGKWDYHLLPYHCLDVAAVGSILIGASPQLHRLAKLCSIHADEMLNWLTFVFAIHDIGKFSNGFQSLIPELCLSLRDARITANYHEKHWSIGYRFLSTNNSEIFSGTDIDLLRYWYSASVGHHGRPPQQVLSPQPQQLQFSQGAKQAAVDFITQLKKIFSVDKPPFKNGVDYYRVFPRISWFVAGATMLADWIASNQNWFPFYSQQKPLQAYYENIALKQAKIAAKKSGILPVSVSLPKDITELFPKIEVFTNLQNTAAQIEIDAYPQLFIIEEETGRGKTEAALTLAHRIMSKGLAQGIYFALPTMATANAMHKRIENVYKKFYRREDNLSFILAHSASKMYLSLERTLPGETGAADDDIRQDCPFWLADNRKKALLADVGVGTIDQALLAVLQAKHQALRLLGLSSKVIIADEVHACDDYVYTLLRNLLRFHSAQGGNTILLSATLPNSMRKELIESFAEGLGLSFEKGIGDSYPLLTKYSILEFNETPVKRDNHLRTVEIQPLYDNTDVFVELKKILDNGQCACWVRNTVYDAIEAYYKAQDAFGEENIILFHARFTLGDRLDIESKVLSLFGPESGSGQRKGRLVIATQVVEQSLDLDFDYIVTDLAPIDLIIQRAGRLHRHNRNSEGDRVSGADKRGRIVLAVFMPVLDNKLSEDWYRKLFPKASKVYQHHGRLWLTARWLFEHRKFTMPADARSMIEYVYGENADREVPEVFERRDNCADGDAKAAASMANFNALNLEDGYMPDGMLWIEDSDAPTRLGEPTVLLRLALREDDRFTPLICKGRGTDWELSQVSIYKKLVAFEDETCKDIMDEVKEEMPDKGKYCLLILLEGKGCGWAGKARDQKNQNVTVYYDNKIGLQIIKGDADELN